MKKHWPSSISPVSDPHFRVYLNLKVLDKTINKASQLLVFLSATPHVNTLFPRRTPRTHPRPLCPRSSPPDFTSSLAPTLRPWYCHSWSLSIPSRLQKILQNIYSFILPHNPHLFSCPITQASFQCSSSKSLSRHLRSSSGLRWRMGRGWRAYRHVQ